jgi:predicted transcriptional regulator
MKNFSFENKGGIKMGKKKSMSREELNVENGGLLKKELIRVIGYNISGEARLLGISERTVYYYLKGERVPSFDVINKLKNRMSADAQRLIEYYEAL